jgi:hypothetical protein
MPRVPAEGRVLSCDLCRKCRESLSTSDRGREPATKMPQLARANGNWHGPQPLELLALSYVEQKVIQLVRLYICVKRVFVDSSAFARVRQAEVPLCYEKNVVAYPQNPDAMLPIFS